MSEVGPQIRRLRKANDWTVAQLAVYADMSPSAVSQIETGRRSPTSASLEKLAEALGVGVRDLFPLDLPPLLDEEELSSMSCSEFMAAVAPLVCRSSAREPGPDVLKQFAEGLSEDFPLARRAYILKAAELREVARELELTEAG